MEPEFREKRPRSSEWTEVRCPPTAEGIARSAWVSGPVFVISTLIECDLPDGAGVGLTWHLSLTRKGKRARPTDARRVLRAFDLVGVEEDNHHPGQARQFFQPVDPAHRVSCECKTSEEQIVEPDGFRWSNPRPGQGACRGCELEDVMGVPCRLHAKGAA